ncbi:hypothetical protein Pse7367_2999 [Thalassoporum mexicanum PCC 7367]|uniref:hypothetical protein n=1 Tax=Thalassoporum mexicanum TaxID=3457544 RepID=UPI00029FD5B0|nr:hypothetical protein [Pseudanabaena sp. PCC 7367]AFY71249.1 hypothetical protein Pse7367_2999 [Pseudanabaena sp. PCC 7367]
MPTIALVDQFANIPSKQPIVTELALGAAKLKIVYQPQRKSDRVLNTLQDTLAITEQYLEPTESDTRPEFIDRTNRYFAIQGDRLMPINPHHHNNNSLSA